MSTKEHFCHTLMMLWTPMRSQVHIVKEKFSLSDEAYHELSMFYSDLPRLHQTQAH